MELGESPALGDPEIDLSEVIDDTQRPARGPDAVVCSPVRRAVETARPCAEAAGRALRIVDDLREVDFGIAEGRTLAELHSEDPDMVRRFRSDPAQHAFPGAELPEVAATRCAAALRELADSQPGSAVLVIAHNTVLRLAMCALLDLPVGRYRQVFPRLDNGAVTELAIPGDRSSPASLLSLNVPVPSL
jgi:broad specificity phosphatase PhoE